MERFRLSYSRLPGMSNSDSAGSSIDAAESHLPRPHPAQHGADALSSANGIACAAQGSASLLPVSGSPPLSPPDRAGGIIASAERAAKAPVAVRRSEDAQEDRGLAQTQAALSAWPGTETGAGKGSHAGQKRPSPEISMHRLGSDHGSADEASVNPPAAGGGCVLSPTAGPDQGSVLPEHGEGVTAAWGRASSGHGRGGDQAEVEDERLDEEEEGTPGDRGGLADSAYTLRQAVHALSKGSAMALFAPDAVVRPDRIKAARGVASPQPDQAPAGSASTQPTGSARAANGLASTESGGLAAAEPAGTASRESMGSTKELPKSLATSAIASDTVGDTELGQNTLGSLPGSFLNTISLPGLHAHAVKNAEGGQDPAASAHQSLGKEARVQACDSQRNGEADIMAATVAVHAVTGECEALDKKQEAAQHQAC